MPDLELFSALKDMISALNGIVWGPPMLVLILGVGLYLSIRLKGLTIQKLGLSFRLLFSGFSSSSVSSSVSPDTNQGDISGFNALMTSLSATIGTGNIAGVATAIFLGGPGALFWMWCTALVGMATKYAEAVLAVQYRQKDQDGNYVGGPMYYIRHGLGENWRWLAIAFAVFGMLAGFGIGNTVQANSVADVLQKEFSIPVELSGAVMAILVAAVILGGVKRIASVAGALVPFMAVAYVVCGLLILAIHFTQIPAALSLVVTEAFTPTAATGGFAGATVWAAIQWGVARGVFSNEAGLGSAPIAHAAAKTNSPVEQGLIAGLGTFIDTIIICSITGLVIIISGEWTSGETGAALSSQAFSASIPFGNYIVIIGLCVFAFTTLLGWSYYGERCVQYLFGTKSKLVFRVFWVIAVYIGATSELSFVWLLADTLNAMMALPNLIALFLLSPVVFELTRRYLDSKSD